MLYCRDVQVTASSLCWSNYTTFSTTQSPETPLLLTVTIGWWSWSRTDSRSPIQQIPRVLWIFLSSFFFFIYLLVWQSFLPNHCRCKGLLLHLTTPNDLHTLGRTPLEEGSARRRELYVTIHNTQKRGTSMSPAGFERAIPASEQPKTYAWNFAATGIGVLRSLNALRTGDADLRF